jgi:hypothetical protein
MKTLASVLLLAVLSMLALPLANLTEVKDVGPGEVNYLIQDIKSTVENITLKLNKLEKKKFAGIVNSLNDRYDLDPVPIDSLEIDSLINNE